MAAAPGRLRGFHAGAREIDDAPVHVEGELPPWLRGTLQLNGPALWELPGGALLHWFDGYAMWHALHIGEHGVRYRSRFAQSESFRRSREAGAPVFGEFGTPSPAGLLQRLRGPQITDNPAVVMSPHGSRWMSVTETPFLTYFNPDTLATEQRLALDDKAEPMHLMSAHGTTLDDGSYVNVATAMGPSNVMKLFRLDPGATRPCVLARWRVDKPCYTHGIALAPGCAVVWETALRGNSLAFRFGGKAYAENFRWEPSAGSRVHTIALDGGEVHSWRIPPMMAFHATQAWREGPDVMLDMAVYDDARIFDDLRLEHRRAGRPLSGPVRHVRYRLAAGRAEAEPQDLGHAIELQQVNPRAWGRRRARVCWGSDIGEDGRFLARTLRWDLASGECRHWSRPGATQLEPLFVPRPGADPDDPAADDDGVLLVPTLADEDVASVIAVVDARRMDCIAELQAPQVLPFGFHAAFRPATA